MWVRPVMTGLDRGRRARLRQEVQAQGELEFQGPGGGVPVLAQEAADPVEALYDRVDVDVQGVLGLREARAVEVVGLERVDQLGAALGVVLDDGAEHPVDVPAHVTAVPEQQAHEAQVGQGGSVAGVAQGVQGLEAADGLGVHGRQTARPVARRRSPR